MRLDDLDKANGLRTHLRILDDARHLVDGDASILLKITPLNPGKDEIQDYGMSLSAEQTTDLLDRLRNAAIGELKVLGISL